MKNLGTSDWACRMTRAVKAELARRGLSGNDLVVALGIGRNAVYSRLRFEVPFDANELVAVAEFLGMDMSTLIASADLELREAS